MCRVARRSDAAYIGAMLIQRLVLLAALCALASPALAQPDPAADYPNHPVSIIVSTSAGGGVDTVTRIIGAALQEKLGQPPPGREHHPRTRFAKFSLRRAEFRKANFDRATRSGTIMRSECP